MNDDPFDPYQTPRSSSRPAARDDQTHSWLGIVSFIGSLISGGGVFVTFIVAGVLAANDPAVMEDDTSPAAIIVGLGIMGFAACSFITFGLGLGCMFQANHKKIFGILGMIFSGLIILGTVALLIVGLAMG